MSQVLDTLDVGGVYDPTHDRYDHHQKGFSEIFGHGFTTKLSSAGLVYKVILLVSQDFLTGQNTIDMTSYHSIIHAGCSQY